MKLKASKVGMALGLFVALLHVVWEVVIYSGNAQKLVTWKLGMHSLNNPFTVSAFNATTAIELVILAFIGGYILGAVFAWIWNSVH